MATLSDNEVKRYLPLSLEWKINIKRITFPTTVNNETVGKYPTYKYTFYNKTYSQEVAFFTWRNSYIHEGVKIPSIEEFNIPKSLSQDLLFRESLKRFLERLENEK